MSSPSNSTYSSSKRYGGAPKDVFNATFTDGTALAPSTRPKRTVAFVATRVVKDIKTLGNVDVEVETWAASNDDQRSGDVLS
jgi:hypothetical protein